MMILFEGTGPAGAQDHAMSAVRCAVEHEDTLAFATR